MSESPPPVTIDLRIPGNWKSARELVERFPRGCRLTPEALVLADGTKVELGFLDADGQFPAIFRTSCRRPPADEESAVVDGYTVNVTLSGPGGSLEAARRMMRAAAAVLEAGGAGVFIDNSLLAHGAGDWQAMTDDAGSDAVSFAFIAVIRGESEIYTMGMHTLGLRDLTMKLTDAGSAGAGSSNAPADDSEIVEVIRYLARGDKPIDDGHVIADLDGPRYQAFVETPDAQLKGSMRRDSPMFNPFGRLKLVSMRDIAESN
jgi:hypothetical protein